jgi:hypothetical protein
MMIMQPSFVGTDILDAATARIQKKGLPAVDQLRWEAP